MMATIAFIGSTKTVNFKLQGVSSNVLRIVAYTISVVSASFPHFLDREGREPLAKASSIGCVRQIHTNITCKRLFHVLHTNIPLPARDVASPAGRVDGLTSEWNTAYEYSSHCKHSAADVPCLGRNDSGDVQQFRGLASFSPSHSRN